MFKFFVFLFSVIGVFGDYKIKGNTFADFILTYNSDFDLANSYRFSTAMDDQYLINNIVNNDENCRSTCAKNKNCLGIYEYYLEGEYNCRRLNNLGVPEKTNVTSNSYTKITHHNLKTYEHSLVGDVYDSMSFEQNFNTTVYLDINHNGVLDDNEPYQDVALNSEFRFNNLTEGLYLVRQIVPNECYQLYPGLNSTFQIYRGDGFADNVVRYIHYGHPLHHTVHGGIIGETRDLINQNFSYIVGDNNNTYLTFYSNYSITLSFVDESIIDNDGLDLYIDIYDLTNITANVSVSSDDVNFHRIGVLNTTGLDKQIERLSFDLHGYNHPVGYVRLDFNGSRRYDHMDIVRVGVYERSVYLPEYGYLAQVPGDNWLFFYNDCEYYFDCYSYCNLNFYYDDDYFSCCEGCFIFEDINYCDCEGYSGPMNFYDYFDYYYDDDYEFDDDQIGDGSFNLAMCNAGCAYSIRQSVYPNYTVFEDTMGLLKNSIYNSEEVTLDYLVEQCNNNSMCGSISLDNAGTGNLYNSHTHLKHQNYTFIQKNDFSTSTSTTATYTSTTATDTSTTATDTSTTATDTSTTATYTSTTATDTSTTATDTSTTATDTSTTATDTSTTATDTSTTATDTSRTSSLYNSEPDKSRGNNNSKAKTNLTPLYVILGLVGAGGLGFAAKKKIDSRGNRTEINRSFNDAGGFNNPVYGLEETDTGNYQEIQANNINSYDRDYIEIEESDVTTSEA